MQRFAAALLVFCVFVAAASTLTRATQITVANCQDRFCTPPCTQQNFSEFECLKEAGTQDHLTLSCYKPPAVCADITIYSDSACTQRYSAFNGVCNSCQRNFSLSCGALHGALFWATNCTDRACQNCGDATIVPFGKCKQVDSFRHVIVHKIYDCEAVEVKTYPDSGSCTGSSWYDFQYASGKCTEGVIMTCDRSAAPFRKKSSGFLKKMN